MATFEEIGSHGEDNMGYRKFPLRRMEPAIQKFLKVVQIDLGRLHSHKLNMERYNRLHDWSSLNVEQINATRTLQQLQSNLREIEKCRNQVEVGDLQGFDGKIEPVKTFALHSLAEFLPLCNKSGQGEIEEGLIHTQRNERHEDIEVEQSSDFLDEVMFERPEDIEVAQSSDVLDEDAMFPLIGAAVGIALGGPVGLAAGLRIGGLVGAVSGTAGFFSGSMLKKRLQETVGKELPDLRRSTLYSWAVNKAEGSDWFSWGRKK